MKRTLLVALKRTKTNSEGILLVGKRKNNDEGFSLLVALQKTKQEGREGISLLVAFKKERKRRGKYFLVTVKRKKTTRGGESLLVASKDTEKNDRRKRKCLPVWAAVPIFPRMSFAVDKIRCLMVGGGQC